MKLIFILLSFNLLVKATPQLTTPSDYLSSEFHKERRNALRAEMPKNSVALLFANSLKNRANDVNYRFHQDPNFYYLTGYREPNGVLVLFSEDQRDKNGNVYNEILFVQERDQETERWEGKRLGVTGAKAELGFKMVASTADFEEMMIEFKKFDAIFVEKFKEDYRDFPGTDTFDLINFFKKKSGYELLLSLSKEQEYIYSLIAKTPVERNVDITKAINRIATHSPELKRDQLLNSYLSATAILSKKEMQQKITTALARERKIDLHFLPATLASLREVKTAEEIELLKKAIRISAIGQIEVMKAAKPHMSEIELQGIHEFVYRKYGAQDQGYPSIVGAGNNGCILHYTDNNKVEVANELVLMDLGAEYRGYTADITRTIPANGKFSSEQRAIYDLVYRAQEVGISHYTIGTQMIKPDMEARKIINKGLFELGILKSLNESHNYFPHGSLHHIGLDVHDPGNYKNFEENMVVTIEPGIYIPEGSPCDQKWWGIAVRIEDDILVTKKGPVNLSKEVPRRSDTIERMMQEKSVLDEFILPNLDTL